VAAAAGCVGGRRGDYWFIGRLNATYLDPDGYPAVRPPWGTLSAVDLNTAEYAWQSPLGEYPALVEPGLRNTGTENTAARS
jgi:quinoprotein glucose dehydrogenase